MKFSLIFCFSYYYVMISVWTSTPRCRDQWSRIWQRRL